MGSRSNRSKEDIDRAVRRVVALARDLPCLAEAEGIDPFDPFVIEEWTAAEERTLMELHSARLVLATVHPFHDWRCGRFDLDVACWVWDDAHRDAFVRWARDPAFVWDVPLPRELTDVPPSLEETAERIGRPLAEIEADLASICAKLGVRDLHELGCVLTIVMLLSRGGVDVDGHA